MRANGTAAPARSGLFGLSRFHTRLLFVSGVGWMFDAMDVGLLSFVLPTLTRDFGLAAPLPGLIPAFTFLGMFAGAAVAGNLSDRYGRKAVFQWTLILYAVGTGLSAFAWDLPSLLLFRNASGDVELLVYGSVISFFALGAWGVIYTYTPELYPTSIRGWGAGAAAAVGRVAGIFGPFIANNIVGSPPQPAGVNVAFLMFTGIFVVIAVNVVALGEETSGRTLEDIAGEQGAATREQGSDLPGRAT